MTAPKIVTGYSKEQDEFTRLLIIAPPKVGKTFTTAMTAAKNPKDILMVMADEGGARTLRTHRIPCARTFIPGKHAYQTTVDLLIQLSRADGCPYKVVVIDSASMLQQKIKLEVKLTCDVTTKSGKEDGRAIYRIMLDRMREICLRACDVRADLIWTAWLREPFTDNNTTRMGGALLEGQTADIVEGNVDGVLCLERLRDQKSEGGYKYQLRTKPFYMSKGANPDLDNSGVVNANQRLGLPDPFPANIFEALTYDTPEKKVYQAAAPARQQVAQHRLNPGLRNPLPRRVAK